MNATPWMARTILGATLCGSTYTSPTTVYMIGMTALTSDGDSYTEVVSGLGYNRQILLFGAPAGSAAAITAAATFGPSTTPWGEVTHVGITDDPDIDGGNLMYYMTLDEARAIVTNDYLQVPSAQFTVTVS